jgi:8-oxo-dGTP pyrophosphatase MutT (NUDIX family)
MPNKKLFSNEWIGVYETPNNYVYTHEERSGGRGVLVLGFRENDGEVETLGRFEIVPCHGPKTKLVGLTGGCESKDAKEDAVRELYEEGGYKVKKSDLIDLGTVNVSKSSDTILYLYAVDLKEFDQEEAPGDGSEGEKDSYCEWIPADDVASSSDPSLQAAYLRLMYKVSK